MKRLYVTFFCLLLLVSCHRRVVVALNDDDQLPTQVAGTSDRTIVQMRKRLIKDGVRVITMGQNYLISIPSVILFANQSPLVRWEAYGVLNDVACYLQQFRKISVQVNGFSNKYVSSRREHALTLARARAVAEYLWSQGIDSRFIFTQGLGSDKPIVGFSQYGDAVPSSRIEITFRNAVA